MGIDSRKTYFDSFGVDRSLVRRVIERGLSRGGDYCDVFFQHRVSRVVGLEDGEVNRTYASVDLGAGIRVLAGDSTGYAYSEDLSEKALISVASTAASIADSGPRQGPVSLKTVKIDNTYPVDVPWCDVGLEEKLPLVEQVEKRARRRDERIIKVSVNLADETSRIMIATSEGRLFEDDRPMVLIGARCVARHGDKTETGGQSASARDGLGFLSPETLERVACEAADRTTMLFEAVDAPPGEYPVVLAAGVSGILLHEAIGHGMEADFNRKGISIYADRIGKRIAPEHVTIVDDGTCERLRGSINIDDEGTAGQRTVLVENGILRSYLHDRISATHFGLDSTGSGRRQSFRYPPIPRMRNTYMLAGPHDAEEIIRSVKKGLYAEVFSNGQVHIGAGDFTFYLKHGRLIENGKLTHLVKDANLTGSGPKVLEHVDMVADDLAMYSGAGMCGKDGQRVPVGFGLPTVRVGSISVGGRGS